MTEAVGSRLQLNETQSRIIQFLEEAGEAEPSTICQQLRIDSATLQREVTALRHMERVSGRNKNGKVVLRLW